MIIGDMDKKRQSGLKKVLDALKLHNNMTILSTGITGDDARLAKAVTDVGVKLIEPNHPAVALARGYKGVSSMHKAEMVRHEIPMEEMIKVTRGIRSVVPDDVFITVGVPGGFTEILPVILKEEDFLNISLAGADGLHIHKSNLKDLEEVVTLAHKYGLLVDAYIGHPDDLHTFGIPARTPEEVSKVAKQMESIGVDFIGLMTGMSYEGVIAGSIHSETRERLVALTSSVKVPTLAEGGINLDNYQAFAETGVNILVIGTAIDNMVNKSAQDAVLSFLGK
ncbi:histidine biosynthesis protein [Alkaliphilus sp. MSJ-5]|uniref:Histidine biosynthesis protein n=1 Tax=Alkaliphilus flagellatus TaxID=2841507 RepID=A0ABS6G576_9FIRM|nr:histidine biosynthesis protein [Alkaliphilus flagellatus]MBU5677329.1 histidine biosynthesis protein [Alkaliphilus flagellatus]